jgi:hypothetical protein
MTLQPRKSIAGINPLCWADDTGNRHRTFKSKLKAWGICKNTRSHEMEAILQHLIKTNRTDLTRRTSTKTVSVNGRSIDLAQIKRYMRRKGCSQSYLDAWYDTQASQSASNTYKLSSLPGLRYAEKTWHPISEPGNHVRQSIPEKSNSISFHPLDLSFSSNNNLPHQLMLEPPNSALRKRTWASTSEELSASEEDRQPKRQRSSHHTATCRNFACPFYKHAPTYYNPQNPDAESGRRYRSCAGPGWSTIRRLRCVKA